MRTGDRLTRCKHARNRDVRIVSVRPKKSAAVLYVEGSGLRTFRFSRVFDGDASQAAKDAKREAFQEGLAKLRAQYPELQKLGVEVFSVSTDTHFTHKAWHDTSDTIGKINYFMVGDQTGTITNNFGVMREGQGLADRATFLIDPDGVIQAMEITAEGIGRDADDLVRKVKAAQYVANNPGEVCPAKWKEGEETLAPSLDLVGKI